MKRFNIAWVISLMILVSLGLHLRFYKPTPISLKNDLKALPSRIGDWRLARTELSADFFGIENADIKVLGTYEKESGSKVKLYIAYFESQRQGKEIIHYRNRWLHKKATAIEITQNPRPSVRVNQTMFKDRINNQMLLFWYDLNGKVVIGKYRAKLFTILDGLFRFRTNGAIVVISKNIEQPDSLNDILKDEIDFVQALLPILRNYLPSS